MRRIFNWDKKYLYWGVTAFCVIACSILFYMALAYLPVIGTALKALGKILSPFIWGLIITYLLSPLYNGLYQGFFLPLAEKLAGKKKKPSTGLAKALSVLLSIIVFLAMITALVYLIIPQLYASIETIVNNSPSYMEKLSEWSRNMLTNYPELRDFVTEKFEEINTNLFSWVRETILPGLGSFVSNLTAGVYYFIRAVYNIVIGIIVSAYLLSNMEAASARAKRLCYCVLGVERAEKLRRAIRFTDKTFMGFINGKLLDSAIIGLICYIVCAILKMPYALLVSVIIGVTNIIPFFGPLIGAIPSAFIILLVDPIKCLIFVIFIIILQQIDGNIIGPKILGSSIGINGFWVMFSIILGAGLFSFWGMLLGVPVFVVIYTGINILVERRLRKHDLPVEPENYVDLDHIDPVTREPVKRIPEDEDEKELAEEVKNEIKEENTAEK
ncbi:MAG: AI-2E family transporter [Oscillospiraceae bacterium]|nr:AI-2E family transporter [Oscillospiraceae bacterium]